ncbi:hypothetical protein [Streptomyces gardneri]|uniref:hypothetical protein n=1 Tax=Streptomyces gardneri TaxID=66892 RepID=UPI0035E241C0
MGTSTFPGCGTPPQRRGGHQRGDGDGEGERNTPATAGRTRVRDGRRPGGVPMEDGQEQAGLPPGVWMGRGLAALGLAAGEMATERQMELLYGQWRCPDADRIERKLLDLGCGL